MRIIHTSDWHIGQRLYGKERNEEHQLFFDFLLSTIIDTETDALIVAGDIFDVAYPSNSAEEIYFNFLTKLISTTCKTVIIIGGNHDSVSTLNAPKKILKHLNIHIFGGLEAENEKHFIPITYNKENVLIAAIPFLRDKDLVKSVAGQSYDEKIKNLREELVKLYSNALEKANEEFPNFTKIFTGHFHTDGSQLSDSEREIHFGNLGIVNAKNLPKVDYWALGHIHRPQIIGKNDKIRYSGSPIPLSFSERNDSKLILQLEILEQNINIKQIDVPISRYLKKIKGTFSEVKMELEIIEKSSFILLPWIEILIIEEKIEFEQKNEFIEFIAELNNCEILKYRFEAKNINQNENIKVPKSLDDMSTYDLFDHFLEKKGELASVELKHAYKEIIEQINKNSK